MLIPPPTASVAPLISEDSSEAGKATTLATILDGTHPATRLTGPRLLDFSHRGAVAAKFVL